MDCNLRKNNFNNIEKKGKKVFDVFKYLVLIFAFFACANGAQVVDGATTPSGLVEPYLNTTTDPGYPFIDFAYSTD